MSTTVKTGVTRQRGSDGRYLPSPNPPKTKRELDAAYYRRVRCSPEGREAERATRQMLYERMRNDPEYRERVYARKKASRDKRRLKIIALLGGKCAGCGETEASIEGVLQIDHVHNDGSFDRATHGVDCCSHIAHILSKPPGYFQLLCHDCHVKKTNAAFREELAVLVKSARARRGRRTLRRGI